MSRALKKRNIRVSDDWLFDEMQRYDGRTYFEKDKDTLHFSLLLLYDEYRQSDFLQDITEHVTIQEILELVFNPADGPQQWDSRRDYRPDTVSVYVDDSDSVDREKDCGGLSVRGFVSVDVRCSLGEILGNARVKIYGLAALHIVRRGSSYEKDNFLSSGGSVTSSISPK